VRRGRGILRPSMAVATSKDRAREEGAGLLRRPLSPHLLLLPAALIATLALQLTTISYYFYFDDYVPFAEIVRRGPWSYTLHLLTATDVTPNWRPLPGLLYLGSYEIAGMDPLPIHILMALMHTGTAALIYWVIWRTTGREWASCIGALAFGLNPAYVGALSQVTTATQVMAGFFLVATLAAVIECARAEDRRTSMLWLAASVGLYVLAIGSHEGMAIMFPVYGLAFLMFDPRDVGRTARAIARTAPFAIVGFATAGAFAACGCNEADVWGTGYAWNQTLIYMGRLLYPVGLELPTEVGAAHMIGAAVLAAIMIAVAAFGPKIGRIGVLWTLLALAPHVFIEYFTASRYLYLPSPGLALVLASVAIMAAKPLARVQPRALVVAAGGVIVAVTCGWYAYQTVEQNDHFADTTGDWRRFHADVVRVFPEVPEGERVVIIGGPFQKYEYQIYILPAFAETAWGPGRTLQDYEPGSLPAQLALSSGSPYVAEYRDGLLVRVFE
jgi:hypothetical protein